MLNRMFLKALIVTAALVSAPLAGAVTTVNSIDFKVVDGMGELQISADGPIAFDKQDNNADNQIVLEMKDTRLGPSAKRKLDTSSFNSLVSLVSPYQVNGGGDARVVIQLREMAAVQVSKKGNSLHSGASKR